LKNVGSAETQPRRETEYDHCNGEGTTVAEKGEIQTSTQKSAQGKQIPIAIGLESERPKFHEFLQ